MQIYPLEVNTLYYVLCIIEEEKLLSWFLKPVNCIK